MKNMVKRYVLRIFFLLCSFVLVFIFISLLIEGFSTYEFFINIVPLMVMFFFSSMLYRWLFSSIISIRIHGKKAEVNTFGGKKKELVIKDVKRIRHWGAGYILYGDSKVIGHTFDAFGKVVVIINGDTHDELRKSDFPGAEME